MKSILPRIFVFVLFAVSGFSAHAQSMDKGPITPIEYLRPMKNSFSVGVRVIGGAKVQFSGNLGATTYTVSRERITALGYDNGFVSADSNAAIDGRPAYSADTAYLGTLLPDGTGQENRYYTYITGTDGSIIKTGDYVMYNEDVWTRNWGANSESQFNADRTQIGMSSYSSSAAGSTVEANGGASPGIELQGGRVIQRFKHFEWGVAVGFAMSEFNAKTRQSINVHLNYITDYYNVYTTGADFKGSPTPGAYVTTGTTGGTIGGPTFNTTGTGAGGFQYPTGIPNDPDTDTDESVANGSTEMTNPISAEYVESKSGRINAGDANGATADGFWQVKGVYYLLRAGPMVRIPIGKRFAAYASAGYMAGWVGSKFRYEETVNFPNGAAKAKVVNANSDSKYNQQFIGGYYFDANFEWWVTTRTGFYAGLAYEKLGNYEQKFDGRKASVKMDNGLGWRFGIITRF